MQGIIGHYPNFRKYLLEAWERVHEHQRPERLAELAVEIGRGFRWQGNISQAREWYDKGLELGAGDPTASGLAKIGVARCLLAEGRLAEAHESATKVLHALEVANLTGPFWQALGVWAEVRRLQGRFSEALAQVRQHLPDASVSQDPGPYVALLLAAARCEIDLGRLGMAQELMDEVWARVQTGQHLLLRLEAQLLEGRVMLASGQPHEAAYTLQQVVKRARAAELVPLGERAKGLLAETMCALGDTDQGKSMFQNAQLGMLGVGDVCGLGELCIGRARVSGGREGPDELFRYVASALENESFAVLRLERMLAECAWLRRKHGRNAESVAAHRAAARELNRMAGFLNDTERAALRVHPWSRRIRKGL